MKFKDVTPEHFMCHTSSCCPAVLETEDDSYMIIGKKLSADEQSQLSDRIAEDEYVIEVPKGMIDDMIVANQK